jgi:hypothetical protein
MRACVIAVLILTCVASGHAQDAAPTLHIPTAEEYLAGAAAAWDAFYERPGLFSSGQKDHLAMRQTERAYIRLFETEFLHRYGDSASVDQLMRAYRMWNIGEYGYGFFFGYLMETWQDRLLQRGLAEQSVDLSQVTQLEIAGEPLTVQHHNFDGVNGDELLIELMGNSWLAFPDVAEESGYRFISVPLPNWVYEQDRPQTLFFEDINAERGVEWVLQRYFSFSGNTVLYGGEDLIVLGWIDGELQPLTFISRLGPRTRIQIAGSEHGWAIQNIDADPAREIVTRVQFFDNWGCVHMIDAIYDWDGSRYLEVRYRDILFTTLNCALRQGQEALWRGDPTSAIPELERAIALYDGDFTEATGVNSDAQYIAYAQERLVIAYALAGRIDAAYAYLQTLRDHPLLDNTIAAALLTIPRERFNVYTVCQTAFDAIPDRRVENERWAYRNLADTNHTDQSGYAQRQFTGVPDPARVGCDVAALTADGRPIATPPPLYPPDTTVYPPDERQALRADLDLLLSAYQAGDDVEVERIALTLLTRANDLGYTSHEAGVLYIQYIRGLASERSGSDDVRAYLHIVEHAPDSLLGILAALHVQ